MACDLATTYTSKGAFEKALVKTPLWLAWTGLKTMDTVPAVQTTRGTSVVRPKLRFD